MTTFASHIRSFRLPGPLIMVEIPDDSRFASQRAWLLGLLAMTGPAACAVLALRPAHPGWPVLAAVYAAALAAGNRLLGACTVTEFTEGMRVRDTKWGGTCTGTLVRISEDGAFYVAWDGTCVEDELTGQDVEPL